MKRLITLCTILFSVAIGAMAQQAVMPTIIVFPDETWMQDHGFIDAVNSDGETKRIPRYNDAFAQNSEISSAIIAVQKVLADRKFQHEDLRQLLKNMEEERAMNMASAASGDAVAFDPVDELLQQARADIRINLFYSVSSIGPRKNISFRLQAVDAYCADQIAACEGTIEGTMDPLDLALRKVIAGKSDDFCQQMIDYFMDLRTNGRQITVLFQVADGAGINLLRDEINADGDTYGEFLLDWMRKHAVNRACKKGRQTKNMSEFKNVRIPFFNEDGDPMEATDWAKGIRKAFRTETGIKCTNGNSNGLGRASFFIGGQ